MAVQIVAGALFGFLAGLVNFAILRGDVRRWLSGGPMARFLVGQCARLALLTAIFFLAARFGALALLAALAGLLAARTVMVPGAAQ
jgi:hypothetical protein